MVAFYKIKSGRVVGDRDVLTYIGEEGHLFYSQDDNIIRISDGVTEGGIPLSGGSGTYTLVTATNVRLGGVKIGSGFEIDSNGVISVNTSIAFTITEISYFTNDVEYLTSSTVNNYVTAQHPFDQSLNTTDIVHFSGLLPTTTTTSIGSLASPWKDMYLQSGSINIANASNTLASLLVSNTDGYLELNGGGFRILYLTNPIFTVEAITGLIVSNAKTIITNNTNATDTTTGALQIAGGASVEQDVWIGGHLYINYINSDVGDLNLYADTTGTVNVFGNYFHVHTTANPDPVLQVAYDGQVTLRTPTFDSSLGAFNVIGSADGSQVSTTQIGAMVHVTGQPGTVSRIYNDGAANYSLFAGRRYNGTSASPTPLLKNDVIVRYGATAFNGTSTNAGFSAVGNARMEIIASEDQTPFANGAQIQFFTIVTGTTVIPATADLRIDSHGITFRDNTTQDTAAIPLTFMGIPNGVATLNPSGQVYQSQLPAGAVIFKGSWDADTNSPTLSENQIDAIAGWEYVVNNTGTQIISTLTGAVTFFPGDYVIYDGANWNKIPGVLSVITFNGRSGEVGLISTDVTSALGYTPYPTLTNPNHYLTSADLPTMVLSFNGRQNTVTLATSDVVGVLTTGTINNNMLDGGITNNKLVNSSITFGNVIVKLGDTVSTITNLGTLTANDITAINLHGHLNGNADTASKLSPSASINGVAFDGSANITVANTQTLTIGAGLIGNSFNGSTASTISLNTATLMASAINATTATSAATAYALANTSTTFVGLANFANTATNASLAYSLVGGIGVANISANNGVSVSSSTGNVIVSGVPATSSTYGVIKIGAGLAIDNTGTVSTTQIQNIRNAGAISSLTVDYSIDDIIQCTTTGALTINHQNFKTGKVVRVIIGQPSKRNITHGVSAANSNIGNITLASTLQNNVPNSVFIQFTSVDTSLAQTYAQIVY